jgi:hypothetical protein
MRALRRLSCRISFSVGAKILDVEIEGLTENVAKLFTKSYQANIYGFKKTYRL